MSPPRAVCVYCGSSFGNDPRYAEAAGQTGRLLAGAGIEVVYGGGSVGLMGAVADAALEAGGRVVGFIPRGLFRSEVAHPGLTELVEVSSMHERKMAMFERAGAFVALPGGIGTLEELTETATWLQIGMHQKPVVTVDIGGYWQPLHALLQEFVDKGFMKRSPLRNVTGVAGILEAISD